jgi:hypothetical protein
MCRDQDHVQRPPIRLDQSARDLEAALRPEQDVHQRDVRLQLPRPLERLVHVRGEADDHESLTPEKRGSLLEEGGVVVDDQAAEWHPLPRVAHVAAQRIAASRNSGA